MCSSIVFVQTLILLAVIAALVSAAEQDTVRCYGDLFAQTVGGPKETTAITFDCPSCSEPKFCRDGNGECFIITANHIHIFGKNGNVSQPSLAIPSGCLAPLCIKETDPGYEYLVQCVSTAPQYEPTRFYLYRDFEEVPFEVDELVDVDRNGLSYAPIPDNNVAIPSQYGLYKISLLANSNQIAVVYEHPNFKIITGCATNHHLLAGPIVENNLQVLVDCTTSEGSIVRQRVLIPTNLNSDHTIQTLYDPLINDTVSFSPQGSYILYRGTSQVVLIKTSQIRGNPGIISFDGPVAQAEFLTDNFLLISVSGQNRMVVDVMAFFATSFDGGKYQLRDSIAHCPQASCQPFVLSENKLYLLSEDQQLPGYTMLSSYNMNNLSAEPTRITRTLRNNMFDICFSVMADIPVIDTVTPTPSPPTGVTDEIPPTGTLPVTDDETPASSSTDPSQNPTGRPDPSPTPLLNNPSVVAGIAVVSSMVLIVILLLAVLIVLVGRECCSHKNGGPIVRLDTQPHAPNVVASSLCSNSTVPSLSSSSETVNVEAQEESRNPHSKDIRV